MTHCFGKQNDKSKDEAKFFHFQKAAVLHLLTELGYNDIAHNLYPEYEHEIFC